MAHSYSAQGGWIEISKEWFYVCQLRVNWHWPILARVFCQFQWHFVHLPLNQVRGTSWRHFINSMLQKHCASSISERSCIPYLNLCSSQLNAIERKQFTFCRDNWEIQNQNWLIGKRKIRITWPNNFRLTNLSTEEIELENGWTFVQKQSKYSQITQWWDETFWNPSFLNLARNCIQSVSDGIWEL